MDLQLLKAKEYVIEGTKRSNLEVTVDPVEGQTEDDIKFEWSVVSFLPDRLTLQIDFEKPYEISMANEFNSIKINIWDPSLFIRASDMVPIAPLSQSLKILPKIAN